jgi:hypothetical protein
MKHGRSVVLLYYLVYYLCYFGFASSCGGMSHHGDVAFKAYDGLPLIKSRQSMLALFMAMNMPQMRPGHNASGRRGLCEVVLWKARFVA